MSFAQGLCGLRLSAIFPIEYFAAMALAHGRLSLQRRSPSADGREWFNKAPPPTSHEITFASLDAYGSAGHPARDAPMVTGFGVPEYQGEGSLLPILVRSGNLSLEIGSSVGRRFNKGGGK